jgi:anti-sigma factor RsiW
MACDSWRGKIEAYADAELSAAEMRAISAHLPSCASCTSDLLSRVQMKRSVKAAGIRFSPSLALRQRIEKQLPAKSKAVSRSNWWPKLAASFALVVIAVLLLRGWSSYRQQQTFAEIADLHVATLASSTPVDVISTDRHTVKPWFAGRIPFTFNIPELAGTPFALEGGRLSYLAQEPGAQLIFKDGNHRISVFIFQNRLDRQFSLDDSRSRRLTFNVETWTADGLRYFIIGDADPNDIHKLSGLLKVAAGS